MMSNRAIFITIVVLILAAGYLLVKSDGNVDMGGEKHGAEATHVEEKSEAPTTPNTATPAATTEKK